MDYADYAFARGSEWLAQAKAAGIGGVCRYYDGGRVHGKSLTASEVSDIVAAGLRIHTVFETSGGANIAGFPQDGAYFTYQQGEQDWGEAVDNARAAGQPKGTPIFLAVDCHMNDMSGLKAYFQGATDEDAQLFRSGYEIGCYGPDYVCEYVRDTFGITMLWPWTPRPPAYPQFDYVLWQHTNSSEVAGQKVDLNDCQMPGWNSEGDDQMTEEQVMAIVRKVLKDDGYPDFIYAANKRFAIDAHHTHTTGEPVEAK